MCSRRSSLSELLILFILTVWSVASTKDKDKVSFLQSVISSLILPEIPPVANDVPSFNQHYSQQNLFSRPWTLTESEAKVKYTFPTARFLSFQKKNCNNASMSQDFWTKIEIKRGITTTKTQLLCLFIHSWQPSVKSNKCIIIIIGLLFLSLSKSLYYTQLLCCLPFREGWLVLSYTHEGQVESKKRNACPATKMQTETKDRQTDGGREREEH